MTKKYRFDKPKPDGPAWVYAGERLFSLVKGGDIHFLFPVGMDEAKEIMAQWEGWQPTAFRLSWYHRADLGAFELRWPWWWTGEAADGSYRTVVAAIRASSPEDAMEAVMAAYDVRPERIEWRFCNSRPDDWSPFGDRFPKARWMEW